MHYFLVVKSLTSWYIVKCFRTTPVIFLTLVLFHNTGIERCWPDLSTNKHFNDVISPLAVPMMGLVEIYAYFIAPMDYQLNEFQLKKY